MLKDILSMLGLRFRRAREKWRKLQKWEKFLQLNIKGVIPLSLLFSVMFKHLQWTGTWTFNPFKLLVFLFQTGVPMVGFVIFLVLLELPVLIFTLYRDELGIPDPNRDFSVSKNGTYGTAEQMTEEQVREWGGAEVLPVEDTDGPIFGQFDDEARKVVSFNLKDSKAMMNRHILVFGASMSGKTFSFVLPHLLQICKRGESVVMSDPKGELFSETSEYFRKHGYIVRVLNFNEFQYSDGWDILSELGDPNDVTKVQERAQIFAETVIANTMSNTEDMFRAAPLSLLKAIMLRVYLDPTWNSHTFNEVFDFISNPQGKEFFDAMFDENLLKGPLRCCLGPYSTYRQQSANLAGNTLSGLANAIQVFQTDRVRSLTSTPGMDLSLPGKRKCAYYLIFPDQHETYRFLTSLFFSFLFIDLVAYADAQPERHCAVPVNCLFEEAKSVGYVPGFATKLSNIRSRHVYITSIWQDLAQVQYLYPDEWSSILNNSSTQLCLGFNDLDTAKLFSDRSGAATIMVDTERHGAFETELNVFHAHNVGEGNRTVFNPDELLRADKNDCFVIFQRMNVLKCHKFPVTLHPAFNEMKETSTAVTGNPVQPKDVIPPIPDVMPSSGTPAELDAAEKAIQAQKQAKDDYEKHIFEVADEYAAWIEAGNKEKFWNDQSGGQDTRGNAYDIDIDDSILTIIQKQRQKRNIDKKSKPMPTSDNLGEEGVDWEWEVDVDATVREYEFMEMNDTRGSRLLPSPEFMEEMRRAREEQATADAEKARVEANKKVPLTKQQTNEKPAQEIQLFETYEPADEIDFNEELIDNADLEDDLDFDPISVDIADIQSQSQQNAPQPRDVNPVSIPVKEPLGKRTGAQSVSGGRNRAASAVAPANTNRVTGSGRIEPQPRNTGGQATTPSSGVDMFSTGNSPSRNTKVEDSNLRNVITGNTGNKRTNGRKTNATSSKTKPQRRQRFGGGKGSDL